MADLFEEVRLGRARERLESQGPGRFRVLRSDDPAQDDVTVYTFRYEQAFAFAGGEPYVLRLTVVYRARGEEVLDPPLVVEGRAVAERLQLTGESELFVLYAECGQEYLPLWQIDATGVDGTTVSLLERHEPPPDPNTTMPASLVHAELTIAGERRRVTDYWDLTYGAERHNLKARYWIRLEPAVSAAGLDEPAHFVELYVPDWRQPPGSEEIRYLGEDLEIIASSPVASYGKEQAPDAAEPEFRRGDVNGEGAVNISDAVSLLAYLFQGGSAPPCAKAADANDDGGVNLSDAVAILAHLFEGGGPLPEPAAGCGVDPTPDDVGCEAFAPCDGA